MQSVGGGLTVVTAIQLHCIPSSTTDSGEGGIWLQSLQSNFTASQVQLLIVYQKGDIVKDPWIPGMWFPKMFQGGWGRSCRGGVGHVGVEWGGSYRVGWGRSWWFMKTIDVTPTWARCRMMPIFVIWVFIKYYLGWGGSCRMGWMRWDGVGWIMQGWGGLGHAVMGWGGVGEIIDVTPTWPRCRMMPIVVIWVFIKCYLGWGGSCRGGVGHSGVGGS